MESTLDHTSHCFPLVLQLMESTQPGGSFKGLLPMHSQRTLHLLGLSTYFNALSLLSWNFQQVLNGGWGTALLH